MEPTSIPLLFLFRAVCTTQSMHREYRRIPIPFYFVWGRNNGIKEIFLKPWQKKQLDRKLRVTFLFCTAASAPWHTDHKHALWHIFFPAFATFFSFLRRSLEPTPNASEGVLALAF